MSSSAKSDGAEPLVCVVGPTASGKTELAVRLAEAMGGEIVNADSVQVYRGFELGSGKPSAQQRARAPHHLIDVLEPDGAIDAARWAELAETAISEIRGRGRRALVAGGSFLWVRALLFGLAQAPAGDAEIRDRHRERAEREGRAALHAELARIDPVLAAKLNPNDLVRVSRGLEVWELTGVPLSRWQADHGFRAARYAARLVGIRYTSEELDLRIRERVEAMLESGWIDEVRSLCAGGRRLRALGSVGYRQICDALASGDAIDRTLLADAIVRATRVFARRQRTWLRDQPVHWIPPDRAFGAPPAELWDEIARQPAKLS